VTVIDVHVFGGLVPRVPPRDLGPDNAQVNDNLLATAVEFRPLAGAATVLPDTGEAGAKTIYRLSRNADGSYRTDDAAGWIVSQDWRSYARGDLNDDSTERTFVTVNDGTQRPRVLDATGEDRVLGVPAPTGLEITLNAGACLSQDDLQAWVDDTFVPALAGALKTALVESHVNPDGTPTAGADAMYCATEHPADGRYAVASRSDAAAAQALLGDAGVGAYAGPDGSTVVPIEALPAWGVVRDVAALAAALRMIDIPQSQDNGGGFGSLTEDQAHTLATALAALFDPGDSSLANLRQQMTTVMTDFCSAMGANVRTGSDALVRPDIPASPDQYIMVFDYAMDDRGGYAGVTAAWNQYKQKLLDQYLQTSDPYLMAYISAAESYIAQRGGDPANSTGGWVTGYYYTFDWWRYYRQLNDYNAGISSAAAANSASAADSANLISAIKQAKSTAASLHDQIYGEYQRRLGSINDLVSGALSGSTLFGASGILSPDADKIIDTRFYAATFVNDWGWESMPTRVDLDKYVEVSQYDSVGGTIAPPPPDRNIQKWRLYRSNDGTQTAEWRMVMEGIVADGLTFQDAVLAKDLKTDQCQTWGWYEPPYRFDNASAQTLKPPKGDDPYLRGLVTMPNGILAGHIDNYVAFCDPMHPYAWPLEYQIPLEAPIVGLGVFGQSLFVGTTTYPYIVTGADSASMSAQKLPMLAPCASARSIVGVEDGVIFAGPDGLYFVSAAGAQLVTADLYAREDWQALGPSNIVAAVYESVYYFWPDDGQCRALDFRAKKLVTVDLPGVSALRRDEVDDALFALCDGALVKLFSTDRMTGTWRSGLYTQPKQTGLAWCVVFGDQSPTVPATVRWYGDGLRYERKVTNIEPFRLPPGRWLEHEVEIESAARITRVQLVSSTAELQGV